MRSRVRWLLLSVLAAPLVWAGKPRPGADLLEFLGSVDSDDGRWSQYLGSTDLDQVVKPGAPKAPVKAVPPAGTPGAKAPPPAATPASPGARTGS